MPIYEYVCLKCKAHTETMQKMTDKPLVKCRKCGGRLEKQWSQSGFQFKGSGWYVTDYAAKKAESKEEKKDTKEEKKAVASEGKSEKPAPKETSKETATNKKATETKSASTNTVSGD